MRVWKSFWADLETALRAGVFLAVSVLRSSHHRLPPAPWLAPLIRNGKVPPLCIHSIAVFGADDRTLLPSRLKALEAKIGMLYEPRSRSVCTAFCIDESTVATAAHCLYRTRGERPLPLANVTFRLSSMGKGTKGVRIAGAAQGAAAQNVDDGHDQPIDETTDRCHPRLGPGSSRRARLPQRRTATCTPHACGTCQRAKVSVLSTRSAITATLETGG